MFATFSRYLLLTLCSTLIITLSSSFICTAHAFAKLEKPPLEERWFGIYVDNERVGFYTQRFTETADGYRIDTASSVRMNVMGFSKDATTREIYLVSRSLALQSLDVSYALNGNTSHVYAKKYGAGLKVRLETGGKTSDKQFRFRGDIYPAPTLNILPLTRSSSIKNKTFKVLTFDPEELKVKEVAISVFDTAKAPNGTPALMMRNNLYPFVHNDIWIEMDGQTTWESVRDGLVITKSEPRKQLAAFVAGLAIARKDPVADFTQLALAGPITAKDKLKGLAIEISGWDDSFTLTQNSSHSFTKPAPGHLIVRSGSSNPKPEQPVLPEQSKQPAQAKQTAQPLSPAEKSLLAPQDKIETDASQILQKALEITKGQPASAATAKALSAWTSDWLKPSLEDDGSALSGLKSKLGTAQTYTRLYTALARAAGIPTRIVSGLVSADGKTFNYHCWAESWVDKQWLATDPFYRQFPADMTHVKLLEGETAESMAPLAALIGKIRIKAVDQLY